MDISRQFGGLAGLWNTSLPNPSVVWDQRTIAFENRQAWIPLTCQDIAKTVKKTVMVTTAVLSVTVHPSLSLLELLSIFTSALVLGPCAFLFPRSVTNKTKIPYTDISKEEGLALAPKKFSPSQEGRHDGKIPSHWYPQGQANRHLLLSPPFYL